MQLLPNVASALVALVTGLIVFAVWLATRKRYAAATVGRARDEARRMLEDAAREAEAKRKEAVLAGKEEAHELLRETEKQTHARREEIVTIEKEIAEKTHALTDRESTVKRAEADVGGGRKALRSARRRRAPTNSAARNCSARHNASCSACRG